MAQASQPSQPSEPKNHVRTPHTILAFLDYITSKSRRLWLIHVRPTSKKKGDGGDQKGEVDVREKKELAALHNTTPFQHNTMSCGTLRAYYNDTLNLAQALAKVPPTVVHLPKPNNVSDEEWLVLANDTKSDTRAQPPYYADDYAVFAKDSKGKTIFTWAALKVYENQLPTSDAERLHLTRRAVSRLLKLHKENTRPGVDIDDFTMQEYLDYVEEAKEKKSQREAKTVAAASGQLGSARKRKADAALDASLAAPASDSSNKPPAERPATGSLLQRLDLDAVTSSIRARSESRLAARVKADQVEFLPLLQSVRSVTDKAAFDALMDELGIDVDNPSPAVAGLFSSLSSDNKVRVKSLLKPGAAARWTALFMSVPDE